MDKTLGRIGREAYEAKWRELCPELHHEPFDPGRDCSANGDVADEACAAAVVRAFLERDGLGDTLELALKYYATDAAPGFQGRIKAQLATIQEARRGK